MNKHDDERLVNVNISREDYEEFIRFKKMQQQYEDKGEVMPMALEEDAEIKPRGKQWGIGDLFYIKDELVRVRSIFKGKVIYIDKPTNTKYVWYDEGDEHWLRVEVIQRMSYSKLFFRELKLYIDDDRVVEALKLRDMYDAIGRLTNLDNILLNWQMEDIKRLLEVLPQCYVDDYIKGQARALLRARRETMYVNRYNLLKNLFKFDDIDID